MISGRYFYTYIFIPIRKFKKYFFSVSKFISVFILQLIIIVFLLESGLGATVFIWKNIYRFIHQKDDSFYIYCTGESTSAGEPFGQKITFAQIASYMFDNKILNKRVKIINLAYDGRNVEHQYWQILKELVIRPKSDGILLIYAGINDKVGWKKESPDRTFKRWRLMQKSVILSRLQYLLEGRVHHSFLVNFFGLYNSLPKYEYRLKKIINLAKRYDLKVIISTLVGNISQFNPQDGGNYVTRKKAFELFNSARKLEDAGEFKMAIGIYENILKKFKIYPADAYYRLGKCYEGLQVYDKAREYYWKVIDIGDSIRPNHSQNNVIRKLAKECNIGLVDALQIFEENSVHKLLGYNFFIDGHHPNIEGYILLGNGFAKEMEKLLGEKIARADITTEEATSHFGFSKEDMLSAYISRTQWLCLTSLKLYDREERLIRAEYYLKKAEEIKEIPAIYFWHFVIAILRDDEDKALYWVNKGKLLTENRAVFLEEGNSWVPEYISLFESILPESALCKIMEILNISG